ncbi:MAG: hypothetical protein CMN22_00755 [Rubrivirga sp.]|nr:hypothetical protein [Rubrivirga sp.]
MVEPLAWGEVQRAVSGGSMDIVYDIILILHFIGLASVVGGFLVQMKSTDRGGSIPPWCMERSPSW